MEMLAQVPPGRVARPIHASTPPAEMVVPGAPQFTFLTVWEASGVGVSTTLCCPLESSRHAAAPTCCKCKWTQIWAGADPKGRAQPWHPGHNC
eukprot:22495-Pelagomonas_calceolata.AAC.1